MRNIINLAENNKKLTKLWLIHSVTALALSGFFAIFLVVARSPYISALLPYKDFFKTSLTIHVNLSVLIWLTSMACTIFSTKTSFRKTGFIGLAICAIGTLLITISIFDTNAEAYLNNYIPMLQSRLFEAGIIIYLSGLLISSFMGLKLETDNLALRYYALTSFFIVLASGITLGLTYLNLENAANRNLYNFGDYYEKLFWGCGHIIQFLYTNGLMMAGFWLVYEILKIEDSKKERNLKISVFFLNLIFALTGIYIILNFDVSSFEYTNNFTKQMKQFGGFAPMIAFLVIITPLINNYSKFGEENKPQRNAVVWSIILFGAGGVISMMINGVNTIIPAHYHGSIVGISLIFMGFVYQAMPKLGFQVTLKRTARIQPILYGFGQLLHITGFAISGGYGALRKTPGAVISPEAKVYMGLMGIGGLISIIGGLLFVIVICVGLLKSKRK